MKVLKFGGSSVATSENIKKVLAIIDRASKNNKIAVVVSAFGKTTNNLLAGADEALKDINSAKETLQNLKELHFNVIDDLVFKNKKDANICFCTKSQKKRNGNICLLRHNFSTNHK